MEGKAGEAAHGLARKASASRVRKQYGDDEEDNHLEGAFLCLHYPSCAWVLVAWVIVKTGKDFVPIISL